jgi:hypothetical protein
VSLIFRKSLRENAKNTKNSSLAKGGLDVLIRLLISLRLASSSVPALFPGARQLDGGLSIRSSTVPQTHLAEV